MPLVALFDTNIWVSALLNPSGLPAHLVSHWIQSQLTVITSLPLLDELSDVLHRPRLRRKYNVQDRDISDFLRLLAARTILVPVTGHITICRDPDDNIVLETAIAGEADYLVTRDDDLKRDAAVTRYMQHRGVQVMSVSRFLKKLSSAQ